MSAVLKNDSLHGLVVQIIARIESLQFTVPDDYDYSKCTSENYSAGHDHYFGMYTSQRVGGDPPRARDYTWHTNYTKERQLWQDHIINLTTSRHNRQPRPWIVFTCGAMGCGKGFTFEQMSRHGHFPVEDIVRVDPDYFKVLMPEWNGYLQRGRDAGTMTHKESAYIQELCQEVALERGQNIWVDGSLRDWTWFLNVFDDIRNRHPQYRIGIIHVNASSSVVKERVAARAGRTGRAVPEELVEQSIEAPTIGMFELSPKCDFVVRVDNEVTPTLKSFSFIDRTGNWGVMSALFSRLEPAAHEFPNALAPLPLVGLDKCRQAEARRVPNKGGSVRVCYTDESGKEITQSVSITPLSLIGILQSPTWGIARRTIGIPDEAVWMCHVLADSAQSSVFADGGFLFFDEHQGLITAVHIGSKLVGCPHFMEFGRPISKELWQIPPKLREDIRWGTIHLPALRIGGAQMYAWVSPGELPEAGGVGGFLFALEVGTFVFFSLRVPGH